MFALVLALATCVGRPGPCTATESFPFGGRTRTYRVHLPASHDPKKPQPAIVVLHGRLGTGEGMERLARFDEAAEKHGFVVIEPDGVRRSWADERGITPASKTGVDDIGFLAALVDALPEDYSIDKTSIAMAGMSNGAFMATSFACAHAEKLRAIALVAGGFSDKSIKSCAPKRPIDVLMIDGDADPLVPYAGGPMRTHGVAVGAEAGAAKWRSLDGKGARVELVTVHGGGHTWPGGWQYLPESIIGRTDRGFSATERIADFAFGR